MGMAASQARYLGLTARKTNTEYEGQQINQARTALDNQSANLWNRMLALQVPTAPKTTDYTTQHYAFTDGYNDYEIDSYQNVDYTDPDVCYAYLGNENQICCYTNGDFINSICELLKFNM